MCRCGGQLEGMNDRKVGNMSAQNVTNWQGCGKILCGISTGRRVARYRYPHYCKFKLPSAIFSLEKQVVCQKIDGSFNLQWAQLHLWFLSFDPSPSWFEFWHIANYLLHLLTIYCFQSLFFVARCSAFVSVGPSCIFLCAAPFFNILFLFFRSYRWLFSSWGVRRAAVFCAIIGKPRKMFS
jgi:hypothetical protein